MAIARVSSAGSVRAVIAAGALLAVAACGSSGATGAGPATGSSGPEALCSHGTGFEFSLVSTTGGQVTPVAAATWFAAHGGMPSLPTQDWHVVARKAGGATLGAGSSQAHVVQGSDKTWQVDSGTACG